MTAAEFQAAGLYDPAAPDAPARLELLEWLAAQGATLADMREAQLHWSSLTGLAGDLALRAGERLTLAEVAARSGMSPERIERFNLAAAFPPVDPEERVFDPGSVAMFAGLAAAEQFFGQGPLRRTCARSRRSIRSRTPSGRCSAHRWRSPSGGTGPPAPSARCRTRCN